MKLSHDVFEAIVSRLCYFPHLKKLILESIINNNIDIGLTNEMLKLLVNEFKSNSCPELIHLILRSI